MLSAAPTPSPAQEAQPKLANNQANALDTIVFQDQVYEPSHYQRSAMQQTIQFSLKQNQSSNPKNIQPKQIAIQLTYHHAAEKSLLDPLRFVDQQMNFYHTRPEKKYAVLNWQNRHHIADASLSVQGIEHNAIEWQFTRLIRDLQTPQGVFELTVQATIPFNNTQEKTTLLNAHQDWLTQFAKLSISAQTFQRYTHLKP